ncbi:MAG: 16S rRNA (uracil(1498)-N(3))-methyltransferase [Candidatus Dependentiae bacterium]|nr:16S rRNA (uracil(1498)-N(3))-methyltransferase [Candidatus Dependentiae bacterium]
MPDERHEFALFCPTLPDGLAPDAVYGVVERELVHRLVHVLRVEGGESLLLFDRRQAAGVVVQAVDKHQVTCRVAEVRPLQPLSPAITWYLPLLAREAYEAAVSILTSMGALAIVPLITEKSEQRNRPADRLERVMIAAAEQSKQLVLPRIAPVEVLSRSELLEPVAGQMRIFFDPAGEAAWNVLSAIRSAGPTAISCLIGPEADLTEAEKDLLREAGVHFCALTPTILRAEQAVTVAMGLLRSC